VIKKFGELIKKKLGEKGALCTNRICKETKTRQILKFAEQNKNKED